MTNTAETAKMTLAQCGDMTVEEFVRMILPEILEAYEIRLKEEEMIRISTLEVKVIRILKELGVPEHLDGYQYLKDAIILSIKEPKLLGATTTKLYPKIAKMNHTTSKCVTRSIGYAIERAWNKKDKSNLNKYNISEKTNAKFISALVNLAVSEV